MTANIILSGQVVTLPELTGILKSIAEALEAQIEEARRRDQLESKLMRWWRLPEGLARWLARAWPKRWLLGPEDRGDVLAP